MVRFSVVIVRCVSSYVPAHFIVNRLVADGRFSISSLPQMFCHG